MGAPFPTYAFDRAFYYDGVAGLCNGPELWQYGTCVTVTPQQVRYLVPALGGPNFTTLPAPAVQRNSFRTLGNQEHDISVQRTFHIHESQNFDFRAECFNVLNQGYTGSPDVTLTDILPADGSLGMNTVGDFEVTRAGHRNLRFYAKYSF